MKTVVGQQQNIYDMCIQLYGSAEAIFKLMADNPVAVPNVNTVLAPGAKLEAISAAEDAEVLKYYTSRSIKPASGIDTPPVTEDEYLLNVDGMPLLNADGSYLINR